MLLLKRPAQPRGFVRDVAPARRAVKAAIAAGKNLDQVPEVWREEEAAPLVVTCAGIDIGAAKARVRMMHGRKRVPTLMKLAARIAKGSVDA